MDSDIEQGKQQEIPEQAKQIRSLYYDAKNVVRDAHVKLFHARKQSASSEPSAEDVERIKTSVGELKEAVVERDGYKGFLSRKGLPKVLNVTFDTVSYVQLRADTNVDRYLYYLPEDNRLVWGPKSKLTWDKQTLTKPDLTKVTDAKGADWVDYGNNIVDDLILPLKDIYGYIISFIPNDSR